MEITREQIKTKVELFNMVSEVVMKDMRAGSDVEYATLTLVLFEDLLKRLNRTTKESKR